MFKKCGEVSKPFLIVKGYVFYIAGYTTSAMQLFLHSCMQIQGCSILAHASKAYLHSHPSRMFYDFSWCELFKPYAYLLLLIQTFQAMPCLDAFTSSEFSKKNMFNHINENTPGHFFLLEGGAFFWWCNPYAKYLIKY